MTRRKARWLLTRLGGWLLLAAALLTNAPRGVLADPPPAVVLPNRQLQAQFLAQQRAYPLAATPPGARAAALAAHRSALAAQSSGPTWTALGPAPVDVATPPSSQAVSGRLTAILPTSSALYVGAAQGGVWRSTNQGVSWTPLTDTQPSLAIGSLTADPRNSNVLYAGTGEASFSCDSYYGAGILKSADGGATWAQLGASTFTGLTIGKVIVHPTIAGQIYATAAYGYTGFCDAQASLNPEGVFESTDGGQAWTLLPVPATRAGLGVPTDLLMNPTNAQELYAAFDARYVSEYPGGVYKSTNGGASWSLLSGLSTTGAGRISLAISADGGTLYAALDNANTEDLLGIYKSTNDGTSWQSLARPPAGSYGPGQAICQCFYDLVLAVDPQNPGYVYFGGIDVYRSIDGGATWTDLTGNPLTPFVTAIHPDQHAIVISNGTIYAGNDGGIWSSANGGTTWADLNGNLAVTEFMSLATHPTDARINLGGTQDNGTLLTPGLAAGHWLQSDVGDGGVALIDPNRPLTMYHTYSVVQPEIAIVRSIDGGATWSSLPSNGINQSDRVLFYPPLAFDPALTSTLYLGTNFLYRSTSQGSTWAKVSAADLTRGVAQSTSSPAISTIAVAPTNDQNLYVGTSDGLVRMSGDGGATWGCVAGSGGSSPPPVPSGCAADLHLPNRYVTQLVVDPATPSTVYAGVSGFNVATPGFPGHVFKSTDGAQSWTNVSASLPDVPVNALALDPAASGTIYAGTDVGVYETTNGGTTWTPLSSSFPTVAVFALALNNHLRVLRAATHGRGVFELALSGSPPPPVLAPRTYLPHVPVTTAGL